MTQRTAASPIRSTATRSTTTRSTTMATTMATAGQQPLARTARDAGADATALFMEDAAAASRDAAAEAGGRQRLDKWLWCARFYKSRTQAAKLCADGLIRINRMPVTKAAQVVKPGDVLTFPWGNEIRVVQVSRIGARRGPADEARGLYLDLRPADADLPPPRAAACNPAVI